MNLQPINPQPTTSQERHTLRCLRCRLWFPVGEMLADLEGPAFKAYYCKPCAPLALAEYEAQDWSTAPVDSGRPDRDASQGRAHLVAERPALTHYEMTLEEHQQERGSYVDPDRYKPGHRDYQPEMLCHTGDGHAVGARNKAAVTCPACRRLMKKAHRCTVSTCCPPAPPQEEFTAFLLHDTLPAGWKRYQDGAISRENDCGITFIWQSGAVQSRLF